MARDNEVIAFEYIVGPGEGQEDLATVEDYFRITGHQECLGPGRLTFQLTKDVKGTPIGEQLPLKVLDG